MNNIKFYGIKEETMRISKVSLNEETENIKKSKSFNDALINVAEKDVTSLNSKISKMFLDVIKKLVVIGVSVDNTVRYDVKNIDDLINLLENYVSNLIIEKGSIKISMFSTNKKEKRQRINLLADTINFLNKCQGDLAVIKKEYDKLAKRNLNIENIEFATEITNTIEENQDPLERTINFYMNKQKRSN